ncbi:hypothetical protein ACF0H5_005711 [Mactra antiquata]
MLKMPFGRRRTKSTRKSFFTDQVIQKHSIAHCLCELYFPEPSLTYDESGAVKDICLSGDLTLVWSRYCIVHVCEIDGVRADFPFTLEDTGQENEVCFSVVLNRNKCGDYSYVVRDEKWHEYSRKVGTVWRRFVLQFDTKDKEQYETFKSSMSKILREVNKNEAEEIISDTMYLLVAVQTNNEKIASDLSDNKNCRYSLYDLKQIPFDDNLESADKESKNKSSLGPPPFEPASFFTFDYEGKEKTEAKEDSVEDSTDANKNTIFCDSLHIHPNELPQTLESLKKSYLLSQSGPLKKATPDSKSSSSVGEESLGDDKKEFLNSDQLPSSERYLPMEIAPDTVEETGSYVKFADVKREKTKQSMLQTISERRSQSKMANQSRCDPQLKTAEELAHSLEAAINNNEVVKAQDFAKKLSLYGVTCRIDVKLKPHNPDDKDKEFNLRVNIEDKESSGSSIMLKVKCTDTIRDLKNRMLIKHMFPVEVQYWIIGKRIPPDNETLEKCRIKTHGYTAFLYLVSAKSAGIDKEEFMRKQTFMRHPGCISRAMGELLAFDGDPNLGRQSPKETSEPSTPALFPRPSPGAKLIKEEEMANFNTLNIDKPSPEKIHASNVGKESSGQALNRKQQPEPGLLKIIDEANTGTTAPPRPANRWKHREPIMHPLVDEEVQQGWSCPICTFVNKPTRPGCELCATDRPVGYQIPQGYVPTEDEKQRLDREAVIDKQTQEAQERERLAHEHERKRNYAHHKQTDAVSVITNREQFTCPICFDDIGTADGVVLRECLHTFCRDCLSGAIQYNEDPVLKCPYRDDNYTCDGVLQDREVKGLVSQQAFAKYLARSLATAESQAQNSFHCKTADCPGWCIYEDFVNFFTCQVCGKENCLTCKVIHQGMNCKQYQDDLKIRAKNDKAASQTQIMLRKMLDVGEAMNCPTCKVIVMKKEGCDWIQCSICKTEICWVTKGPRWGPLGNGDTSGGCRCRLNDDMCHPKSNEVNEMSTSSDQPTTTMFSDKMCTCTLDWSDQPTTTMFSDKMCTCTLDWSDQPTTTMFSDKMCTCTLDWSDQPTATMFSDNMCTYTLDWYLVLVSCAIIAMYVVRRKETY